MSQHIHIPKIEARTETIRAASKEIERLMEDLKIVQSQPGADAIRHLKHALEDLRLDWWHPDNIRNG